MKKNLYEYGINDIFQRQLVLIGEKNFTKLQSATVVICGLGGVGSYITEALARCGIGRLILIDHDKVDISNINRQLCALQSTVGQYKVDVISARIADISPSCKIETRQMFIDEDNIADIFEFNIDYIADAIDYVPGKLALIEHCQKKKIPIISAMGAGRRFDPCKLKLADVSKTHTCPLAKNIRKQLRSRGITAGVQVVFSEEEPLKQIENTSIIGSIYFVTSVMGLIMASEIVKNLSR